MKKILPIGNDLETIPTQSPEAIEYLQTQAKKISAAPPTSWNKADFAKPLELDEATVKKMDLPGLKAMYQDKFRLQVVEEEFQRLYRNTSFTAEHGEIVSAGFKIFGNSADGSPIMAAPVGVYRAKGGASETEILKRIVSWLDQIYDYALRENADIQFVGANVRNFDMRYLAQRCLINGIDLPRCGLLASRYDNRKYFDVLTAWTFDDNKSSISLNRLCQALGVKSPKADDEGEIHGGMVWDIWNEKGEDGAARINRYNLRDVEVLEPLYFKLIRLYGDSYYA